MSFNIADFSQANAQVQGRPLGMAEARGGGGVPCNAQLGWAAMRTDLILFI